MGGCNVLPWPCSCSSELRTQYVLRLRSDSKVGPFYMLDGVMMNGEACGSLLHHYNQLSVRPVDA